jgi:response regulator of citrate/malate metabolism
LQYLQARKELTAANDYGKIGRPRKRFQLAGNP